MGIGCSSGNAPGPPLLDQPHPHSEGLSSPDSADTQARVGGVWTPCTHLPSAFCIRRLLGKARGPHLPLGSPGRTSISGDSSLRKFLGSSCLGGKPEVDPPRPRAHSHHVPIPSQVLDKGLYSCRVSNAAGEAVRTFILTVQGKLGTSLRASPWDP